MTVLGENASGEFFVSLSSAESAGPLTVGNLDLSVGSAIKKTGAWLDVEIGNDEGSVTVGNINLHGSTARGTTDTTMTYGASVSIWADASITVGNITVSGGDGASDNLGTLTTWLILGAGTTETIGNVDYSGYGGDAVIDVSTWGGAGSITGGAGDDSITDNMGQNVVTGGEGADTFVFVTTNTSKAAATMDVITDFNNAAGDKIDFNLGAALIVAEYGEASYADFAAFAAAAEGADKVVMVGQIGSDLYIAVDHDNTNNVDYMVKLTGVSLDGIDLASFI